MLSRFTRARIERRNGRSLQRSRKSILSGLAARRRRNSQGGYAYLMALFLVIALIISSQVAVQNVLTIGRRQREDEMIWRGKQYVRAIRLYYRKTGHYPTTLDDLKKGMPELHFLRYAAYKDPLNLADEGKWRFIYVNASGQIIGSVKFANLQQMAIMDMNGGKIPGAPQGDQSNQPGIPVSSLADQSSANSSSQNPNSQQPSQNSPSAQSAGSSAPSTTPGTTPSGTATPDNSGAAGVSPQNPTSASPAATPGAAAPGASPAATGAVGTPAGPGGLNAAMTTQSLAGLAALKPTGPVDGPVLGGFLTGVASVVDKPSLRVYNGGKKYNQWEFIWNPIEDQAKAVQQGFNNPGSVPGQPGQAIGNGPGGTSIFGNSPNGPGATANGPGSPSPAANAPPGAPTGPQPGPMPQ